MCLTIIPTKTCPLGLPPAKQVWRKFYKIYGFLTRGDLNCLKSIYSGYTISGPGEYKSSRKGRNLTPDNRLWRRVHKGFHVFANYVEACTVQNRRSEYAPTAIVVEVWIWDGELVAGGMFGNSKSYVGTHITITDKEWKKHFPQWERTKGEEVL